MRKSRLWQGMLIFLLWHHLFSQQSELTPRQYLFLIHEIFPACTRIGILVNSEVVENNWLHQLKQAAAAMHLQVVIAQVKQIKDVATQFNRLRQDYKIQPLWIHGDDALINHSMVRSYLIQHAGMAHLPTVVPSAEWIAQGGGLFIERKEGQIHIQINQRIAQLLGVQIPDKYLPNTLFIASK